MEIKFEKRTDLKAKPDPDTLGFGKYFTDYMFEMDYFEGEGFKNAKIVPYGPIPFDPAALVLHYAQETFEGMKAYVTKDGDVVTFRPEMNAKRFQTSNERLCMPKVDVDMFVKAVDELIKIEKDWIPNGENTSLYVRPFMFAYDPKLGVHAAMHYKFLVILSPVGPYYKEGLQPVKIYVEDELVRAVVGGTGFAKCGGNYAASILAQMRASEKGYSQVLWLDGVHHKYVEEVGTMNVMFLINDTVYTSPLNGSILPGITRDSILTLLHDMNIKVCEKALSIEELMQAAKDKSLKEAFGTGTAAVISPIGTIAYKDEVYEINNGEIGELSQTLYDTLTGIQTGKLEDKFGWVHKICKK